MRTLRGVYEGPGCHGILRLAVSLRGVHAVLRAAPGENYFPTLYASALREPQAPPVSVSPIWHQEAFTEGSRSPGNLSRDLQDAVRREGVATVVLARSEGALLGGEKLPEVLGDPGLLVFDWEQITVREHEAAGLALVEMVRSRVRARARTHEPTVNLLCAPQLSPSARAEVEEIERLLALLGIGVNLRLPLDTEIEDLNRITKAWANVLLHRETAEPTARYLQDEFDMPLIATPPLGISATGAMLRSTGRTCSIDEKEVERVIWSELPGARLPWYSRLAPPETFEGKRVAIFGDFTRTTALGHALSRELGMEIPLCGTYLPHLRRDFLFHAGAFAAETFISDDPDEVGDRIVATDPDLIIATRLERPTADELGIPLLELCPPIGQNPLIERPLMGYRGAAELAQLLDEAL